MPWSALAILAGVVLAAGCGAADRSQEPVEVVDRPRTIPLGLIGPSSAVDGDALVHAAYRHDQFLVVRRDLGSGAPRTLLRAPAVRWSIDEIAARSGRVALGMSGLVGHGFAYRVLEASPSGGRPRVLRRASDDADCGGKVSLHNVTPAKAVLVSEVQFPCERGARPSLVLRLHGAKGSRTVMRRELSRDRAGRLVTDPVLYAGEIELLEVTGQRRLMHLSSTEDFAGAEINDHGDLLFHEVSAGRFRTSFVGRGQSEPVALVETPIERAATVRLRGDLIVRYARRENGEAELGVAPVTDPTQHRPLRAWPARVADAELVCDRRRAVLVRQRGPSGPSSAEVVDLPR